MCKKREDFVRKSKISCFSVKKFPERILKCRKVKFNKHEDIKSNYWQQLNVIKKQIETK